MEKKEIFNIFVDVLNSAFNADPAAIHALICNRVPCNEKLAEHPTVLVHVNDLTEPESYAVGLIGIINGICTEITGSKVAVRFSDKEPHKFLGFSECIENNVYDIPI